VLAGLVRREAYVLADIDAFWLIAWVAVAGVLLVLLLRRPPPNPLTPPRIVVSGQRPPPFKFEGRQSSTREGNP
jgi:hypothetical protein